MILSPLPLELAKSAADWRNQTPQMLRTPTMSSSYSQTVWWQGLPGDSNNRYWAVAENKGIAGLTYISWENRSAEISLIINPKARGAGIGKLAVHDLLDMAFNRMNLEIVYGECYICNEALGFWKKVLEPYNPKWVTLPDRKFWSGRYYDSEYFSIRRSP